MVEVKRMGSQLAINSRLVLGDGGGYVDELWEVPLDVFIRAVLGTEPASATADDLDGRVEIIDQESTLVVGGVPIAEGVRRSRYPARKWWPDIHDVLEAAFEIPRDRASRRVDDRALAGSDPRAWHAAVREVRIAMLLEHLSSIG